ncbi:Gfo/Idh/MocA family protein [Candidatus Enterococcus courvalinii]|uniref:Gfo/Idh/MocA family oxidoreductase n=1 Tax=Candidatus Enterococcus courvalinii TaxID=2815329 RepID=A0ABS3HZ54_9ENTE|nr:Gfo/Idh/MocA family oxidoreductase [Enterococcus sp. MSG2901]MBO0481138.1 Gfo/Idh/MocA family oxidoreductase [Enterococcus sp. MSG2901]
MKLAIIGSGKIVQDFLTITKDLPQIELEAIVGTTRSKETLEELKKIYGIKNYFTDYEQCLREDTIDAVYIAVPNHLHFSFTKKALLAGKHVICEKPFTTDYQQFLELKQLAESKQKILLEAITNQYLENYSEIKKQLSSLGAIKLIECNYSQYSSRYDAFKNGEIAPVFDAQKGGGALMDLNIYNIHFVVGLLGRPLGVHYFPHMENQVDTSGILVLQYKEYQAVCIAAKNSDAPVRSVVQGETRSIVVDSPTNVLTSFGIYQKNQLLETISVNSHPHRMYQEFVTFDQIIQHKDFVAMQKRLTHSESVMWIIDQAKTAAQF